MTDELFADEVAWRESRTPYATAVVLWARAPESARPGDRAVVSEDGAIRGWIGGQRVDAAVVEEAKKAMADGAPRVLHVVPAGATPSDREGVVSLPVSGISEDEIELFVQPHLPPPHVVAIGSVPMLDALVSMARTIGYAADRVDDLDALATVVMRPDAYVVVATFGQFDDSALHNALGAGVDYIAFVASARRSATVLAGLREQGIAKDELARVRVPGGLDSGSLSHLEVAAAVLADVVATQSTRRASGVPMAPGGEPPSEATHLVTDPVCGAQVDVEHAAGKFTYDGRTHLFCSASCRRAFEDEPWRYSPAAV